MPDKTLLPVNDRALLARYIDTPSIIVYDRIICDINSTPIPTDYRNVKNGQTFGDPEYYLEKLFYLPQLNLQRKQHSSLCSTATLSHPYLFQSVLPLLELLRPILRRILNKSKHQSQLN